MNEFKRVGHFVNICYFNKPLTRGMEESGRLCRKRRKVQAFIKFAKQLGLGPFHTDANYSREQFARTFA